MHLEAALAVWDYCKASARFIFGDTLGDPVADVILQALRAAALEGKTRAEIADLFGHHKDVAKKCSTALQKLLDLGLVRVETEQTGGRSAERWYAITPSTQPASGGEGGKGGKGDATVHPFPPYPPFSPTTVCGG